VPETFDTFRHFLTVFGKKNALAGAQHKKHVPNVNYPKETDRRVVF
jgi:hypothetical protein